MLGFTFSARTSNIPWACNDTAGHGAMLRLLFVNSTQLYLTTSNSHCGFRNTKKHPISFGKSTCQKIINGQSYCTLAIFLDGKCCYHLKNIKLQPGKFKLKVSKTASDTGKKTIKTMIWNNWPFQSKIFDLHQYDGIKIVAAKSVWSLLKCRYDEKRMPVAAS